jgi:NhaA family Na+:H+ antiporter
MTAITIPHRVDDGSDSPLEQLEHALHPWVAFLVLPMFAFANAGISFRGMSFASIFEPVTLGIAGGLVIGKQIGVFVPLWLVLRLGLARMPENANYLQLYAVSILCGIGFTMSLFIGGLAFELSDFRAPVRLGVLSGSIVCAVLGYLLLRFASRGSADQRAVGA